MDRKTIEAKTIKNILFGNDASVSLPHSLENLVGLIFQAFPKT